MKNFAEEFYEKIFKPRIARKNAKAFSIFSCLSCFSWLIFFIFSSCVAKAEDNGLLWLVNRENPLCEDFRPANLVKYRGVQLREEARDTFVKMINKMEDENIFGLKLQSAYRNFSHQRAVFEEKKRSFTAKGASAYEAEILAARSVQPPGVSEHQLGGLNRSRKIIGTA